MIRYRFGNNQRFKSKEMFDDGNHNDGIAGDGIYGCVITNCSNSIDYYLYADNDSAGTFLLKELQMNITLSKTIFLKEI